MTPRRGRQLLHSIFGASVLVQAACTTAWFSAWQQQRHAADSWRPVTPDTTASYTAISYRVRLRVHADDEYRNLSTDWRGNIRRQVERASELVRHLGVELELVDVQPWKRRTGSSLQTDLQDLAALDAGEDVDVVVAMVGAQPRFASSLEQLGAAHVLGKHVVLRAMDDLSEYEGLMGGFSMVSEEEKTEIYYQRRRYKEAVVLVHEWGHLLGALHATSVECLMYPSYNANQAQFCAQNVDIINLALAHPTRHGDEGRTRWLQALLDLVAGGTRESAGERAALADYVRNLLAEVPPQIAPAPTISDTGALKPPGSKSADIRIVDEPDTRSCTMLGIQSVEASRWGSKGSTARQKLEAKLRASAAKMGGDTIGLPYADLEHGQTAFAAIVRCGP